MRNKKTTLILPLFLLLLAGCEESDSDSGPITLTSGSVVELYSVVGQSKKFTFEASADWKATCPAGWVTFTPRSGSAGSNTITITTTSTNKTKINRSASLTISAGSGQRNVTLVQNSKYAIFDQKEYKMPSEGGTLTLGFKSNLDKSDDLQIKYTKLGWIDWPSEARNMTRGEWSAKTGTLYVSPNKTNSTRTAAFVLSMPSDDGGWMGLDTAFVSQGGIIDQYESSDFTADGTVTVMQQATFGKGIPIVMMGDGFTDKDIQDSTYRHVMERAMECIFSEEPVMSLRDYFNVYAVTAVSRSSGVGDGRQTVFSSVPSNISPIIDFNEGQVSAYVKKVEGIDIEQTLAVVIVNNHSHNGVTNLLINKQTGSPRQYAISLCTLMDNIESEDFRQVIVHEAIGHGLAKLADEYDYDYNGSPSDLAVRQLQAYHKIGWMLNVDTSDKIETVLWSPFIGDNNFSSERIGIYEGAYTYFMGVYRPTEESMMRSNQSPFNAPSRKAIFDRIMLLGEDKSTSTMDEFTAFDNQHKPTRWSYATTRSTAPWQQRWLASPIINRK